MRAFKRVLACVLAVALVASFGFASAEDQFRTRPAPEGSALTELEVGESAERGIYTVQREEHDIWHIEDYTAANPRGFQLDEEGNFVGFNNCSDMYVVLGSEKALLVDLSNQWENGYEDIAGILDEIAGGLEKEVFITHAHPDHVGQFPAFADSGLKIFITEQDYESLDNYAGMDVDKTLISTFDTETDTFDLGGRTLKCVLVQGHTDGSNVLYEVETKIGFSGDAVGSGNGIWLFGDFDEYEIGLTSLLKVIDEELGGEIKMYGGHTWQQTGTGEYIELDRRYVADMLTLVQNVKDGGEYEMEPYSYGSMGLDTNVSYGSAIITVARSKVVDWSLEGGNVLNVFEDVSGKDTTEAVARLFAAGIVKGTSDTTFEPAANLTRAEFMTMLGRAAKAEVDHEAESVFTDVINDGWSSGYIAWGAENGLILGYGDGKFGQYDALTEEQVNLILGRFNEKFGTSVPVYAAPSKNATRASVAILLAAGFTYDYTEPVEVTGGEIRGYKSASGAVDVYKGIPYAADAGGENRWKEPQPVEAWDGVRDCVTWGASAIQSAQAPFLMWTTEYIIEDTGYSEDCLSLNVWTTGAADEKKPVVVYIHGGGLTSGGSSCEVYNGEYMAEQGVVFVSINYRVGILGFMAHPELSAEQGGHSGNYGILDQIQALKWVQENIEKFGGDPSNVTIMGQSAGAMSVNALVQSPLAAGLFSKAVAESGNTINMPHDTLAAREATYAGLFEGKTLEELRAMPVDELVAVDNSGNTCVDGYVLVGQYTDTLAAGTTNDVPMLSGMVEDDTMLFGLVTSWTGINDAETYESLVREKFGVLADAALALYPADENFATNCSQLNVDYIKAYQQIFASARAEKGESQTYLYHLTHVQANHDGGIFGAFHTSDVPYFLNVFSNCREDVWTDADYELGAAMSAYLINFAKTGDPNGEGLAEWKPADGEGSYLELDVPCGEQTLSAEKLELFEDLFTPTKTAVKHLNRESIQPWGADLDEDDFVSTMSSGPFGQYLDKFEERTLKVEDTEEKTLVGNLGGQAGEPYKHTIGDLTYYVYDPVANGADANGSYPIILWLHGSGNAMMGKYAISAGGAEIYASDEAQAEIGGAYIICPLANEYNDENGQTCMNWPTMLEGESDSLYQPYLKQIVDEFAAEHEKNYNGKLIVAGTSAGGYMAWRYTLANIKDVAATLLMAPAYVPTDEDLKAVEESDVRMWCISAKHDELVRYDTFIAPVRDKLVALDNFELTELEWVRNGDGGVASLNYGIEMGQHCLCAQVGCNLKFNDGTPMVESHPDGVTAWLAEVAK